MTSGEGEVSARSRAGALLEAMASSASLMPVHEMEALVALGAEARAEVAAALARRPTPAFEDPLHLLVVAGLLGGEELVPACLDYLDGGGADPAAGVAAMEALARIGPAALEGLRGYLASAPGPIGRIHAYGALGLIASSDAGDMLRRALVTETEVAGAVAEALARRGDPEALAPLAEAYRRAPASELPAFEDALRILAGADRPGPHPITRNWRVRYRRRPAQNWGIEAGWEAQEVLAWRLRQEAVVPGAALRSPRPLEELLADEEEAEPDWIRLDEPGEAPHGYCRRCGRREEEIAGMRICPALARELISTQRTLLANWQNEGETDLFAHLDELDLAVAQGLERLAALSGEEAEGSEGEGISRNLDRLAAEQRTLYFLIEEGSSTAREGITLLSTLARRAPRTSRADLEAHGIVRSWRP